MKDGWIKLHRKSLDSSVFENPIIWKVWCWCLMQACFEEQKFPFNGQDVQLKAGEFITGREKACKTLNLPAQQYRTAIKYLKSTSRITIKSTNRFSIISIVSWDSYQSQESLSNTQINQQTNQPLTNKQPATNQPLTTYKNDKNVNNVKECKELPLGENFIKKPFKFKLPPIAGKTCEKCSMPAVYSPSSGDYKHYYCYDHMPEKIKEVYA